MQERLAAELKCPRPQPTSQALSDTRDHVTAGPAINPGEVDDLRAKVGDLERQLAAAVAERESSTSARCAAEAELQSWRACIQSLETRLEFLNRLPEAHGGNMLQTATRPVPELKACTGVPSEGERTIGGRRAGPPVVSQACGKAPKAGPGLPWDGGRPSTSSWARGGPRGAARDASLETGAAAAAIGRDGVMVVESTRPFVPQKAGLANQVGRSPCAARHSSSRLPHTLFVAAILHFAIGLCGKLPRLCSCFRRYPCFKHYPCLSQYLCFTQYLCFRQYIYVCQ